MSYLLGYNPTRHSLNLLNLSENKIEKTIPLAFEGPQGVPEVNKLGYKYPDSILIAGTNFIHTMDFNGNLGITLRLLNIKEANGLEGLDPYQFSFNPDGVRFHGTALEEVVYSLSMDKLFLPINKRAKRESEGYYDGPALSSVMLKDRKV